MPPFVQNTLNTINSFWGKRTASQRILIGGLAASVVIAFVVMVYFLNRPDWKVLYSKLYAEDASRIVTLLQGQKVPYKLSDNGTTILVPADQVYNLRLKIAGDGMVHGQGLGFELFDEVKIGQTDFVQHINYMRALQGELARTIMEFPEVERARVHLSIPSKSLFIEDQIPPSASVILQLREGQKLQQKQLLAISNLVASAVEGLKKSGITIADTRGQVLFHPEDDDSLEGMTTAQLDYKANLEKSLEKRIEQLLLPIVGGPGKVVARVNADVDYSQKTIKRELYDPASSVVRSETRSQESNQGRANIDGGVPDPNFRGDGYNGSLSTQKGERETRTTNYEINKEEQQIVDAVGELKRLSIAVIVDGTYKDGGKAGEGQKVFVPRSAEQMTQIKQLVENAVGFEQKRGDSIEVTSVSFGGPDLFAEPSLLQTMLEYMQRLGKPFLNGLLIFLFLILVVRPVVLALIKPRVAEEEVEELVSLPDAEERLALEEGVEEEALDLQRRLENAKAQALQLSEQDMDQAVAVLKSWLKQEAA
ncbi:flagellar M-ring protein FliF [Desulfovibrio sp. X2]|uniref:flagellar basal-body MS-ring/collar protein FliF n=1 Tax=Desulfovibrio sp. X2 TaxID=941449 RepID=UPI0003587EB8|nr:flagellar basal-body MS-ring/collar protein FliF [Desulfovibrio sp. X2]EPR44304.1 flagellar M-ring protein FliF [Desulfovibrio sp. X2]